MKTKILFFFCIAFAGISRAQLPAFEWAKSMGGSQREFGNVSVVDNDGNLYTGGVFRDTADFDPGPGTFKLVSSRMVKFGEDLFITKLNAKGDFIWALRIGDTLSENLTDMVLDKDGNIYCTGSYYGQVDFDPGAGVAIMNSYYPEAYILKLDKNGKFLWVKAIESAGSYGSSYATSMILDAKGNVCVTGNAVGKLDMDPGAGISLANTGIGSKPAPFIWKLNSAGNYIWGECFQNVSNYIVEPKIVSDKLCNLYISGNFHGIMDFDLSSSSHLRTSIGASDGFICKLDSNGNFNWVFLLGGAGYDDITCLAIDDNFNIYYGGDYSNTVDFDPDPSKSYTVTSPNDRLPFICKIDSAKQLKWVRTADLSDAKAVGYNYTINLDRWGGVLCSGRMFYGLDFDPGPKKYLLNTNSGSFFWKFDTAGNFKWAHPICYSTVRNVFVDNSANIYATFSYTNSQYFYSGTDTFKITSAGDGDVAIVKFSQKSLGVKKESLISTSTQVFPNPNKGIFNIHLSGPPSNYIVETYNIAGQLINTLKSKVNNITVDISDFPSGIYIVKVKNEIETMRPVKIYKQ